MIILAGTTQDRMECLKVLTGGKKLKDLLDVAEFTIEHLFLIAPDNADEAEGINRTQIAIKVNGVYYKGISERVVKAGQQIIDWIMETPADEKPEIKARITKTSGRYGVFDLELL